ncbi:MAG: BolA family transcriptional regulator [Chromatiaceae bacterium]|nr:MAG: BolA family transcriptional regulator [Chromatiaceae bacterium]
MQSTLQQPAPQASASGRPADGGRQARIEQTLAADLSPLHLEVWDESHMHSVPPGAESHFKVLVVAEAFAGSNLIGRHRRINALLRKEFDQGLHALAIHAWTPEEWFAKGGTAPASPPCQGGSKATPGA